MLRLFEVGGSVRVVRKTYLRDVSCSRNFLWVCGALGLQHSRFANKLKNENKYPTGRESE